MPLGLKLTLPIAVKMFELGSMHEQIEQRKLKCEVTLVSRDTNTSPKMDRAVQTNLENQSRSINDLLNLQLITPQSSLCSHKLSEPRYEPFTASDCT